MSIEDIRRIFREQKQVRDSINERVATSYRDSMFYSHDVTGNEAKASIIDNKLDDIGADCSSIISHIDTVGAYSFYNTYNSLKSVKNKTTKKFKSDILIEIEKSVKLAYETYFNKYKVNYESINSLLNDVSTLINKYNSLDNRIDSLKKEISFHSKDPNFNSHDLYGRIDSLKRERNACLEVCSTDLNQVSNLNNKNVVELLDKGLAKV